MSHPTCHLNASITSTGGVTYQGGAPFLNHCTWPSDVDGRQRSQWRRHRRYSEADITHGRQIRTPHLTAQGISFLPNTLNGLGVVDFDNTGGNNGRDILWQTDNAKSLYDHTAKFSVFAVSRYTY